MLSNHTVATLEAKRVYLENLLSENLVSGLLNILNNDLSEVIGQLNEAKHRHVIGRASFGERVYMAVNPYGFSCGDKILKIEGLPGEWSLSSFDTSSDSQTEVILDGGTNWKTIITFN
tara:strand:+ start:1919 stop:2272 length:354 start_codon:yes stop_codon:yes gene_type:complete